MLMGNKKESGGMRIKFTGSGSSRDGRVTSKRTEIAKTCVPEAIKLPKGVDFAASGSVCKG